MPGKGKPFPRGISGNQKGRPKGSTDELTKLIREAASEIFTKERAESIIALALDQAEEGKPHLLLGLMNKFFKDAPREIVESPKTIDLNVNAGHLDLSKFSDEVLRKIIESTEAEIEADQKLRNELRIK